MSIRLDACKINTIGNYAIIKPIRPTRNCARYFQSEICNGIINLTSQIKKLPQQIAHSEKHWTHAELRITFLKRNLQKDTDSKHVK